MLSIPKMFKILPIDSTALSIQSNRGLVDQEFRSHRYCFVTVYEVDEM